MLVDPILVDISISGAKVDAAAAECDNQAGVMTNADGAFHAILVEHGVDLRCQFSLVFLRYICHVVSPFVCPMSYNNTGRRVVNL